MSRVLASGRRTVTHGFDPLADRLGPVAATLLWCLGWLAILLVLTWVAGVLLTAGGNETAFDRAVLERLHRGRTPGRSAVWTVVTDLGDTAVLAPTAAILGVIWRLRHGDWFALSLLGGAYLGAAVLFNAGKSLVGRARPPAELALGVEYGLSFPSGHATDAAAFYVALALLVCGSLTVRWWRGVVLTLVAALVVAVAVSRLYLAAHWVTDVVGGTALGAAWAAVLWSTLTARAGPWPRLVTAGRA